MGNFDRFYLVCPGRVNLSFSSPGKRMHFLPGCRFRFPDDGLDGPAGLR